MTAEKQDITEDFYAGNSKVIRTITKKDDGSPKDISGAEITYTMVTDAGLVVLSKSSAVGTSEIEIISGVGGEFVIKLKPSDTVGLKSTYRHHANVVDSNGDEETVFVGKVNILQSYARRYRTGIQHAYLRGS